MILWIIVGLIVWILCMFFMLAIFKGGHRIRGHGYEQKLYSRSNANTKDSMKKEVKKTVRAKRKPRTRSNPYLPISAHK